MQNYTTQMDAARKGIVTPEMGDRGQKGIPHHGRDPSAGG